MATAIKELLKALKTVLNMAMQVHVLTNLEHIQILLMTLERSRKLLLSLAKSKLDLKET